MIMTVGGEEPYIYGSRMDTRLSTELRRVVSLGKASLREVEDELV